MELRAHASNVIVTDFAEETLSFILFCFVGVVALGFGRKKTESLSHCNADLQLIRATTQPLKIGEQQNK